ncbi:MAG TPA: HD domain-containing protein [Thermoanaerobaculia bacterium]|nr:HD domain-containing protein [Thermoanaerobaculia bacterium]
MRANESLLDLLVELQTLDRIPRAGFLLRGVVDGESVTEHSWHVLFLVWALGGRVAGLDLSRALGMALVHDLAELRIGDLPRTAARYFPAGAKSAAEAAAMADLLAPLPEQGLLLHDEYQSGKTLEARLVKACDKLQLMLKVAVYEAWGCGGGLAEFWHNPDNFPDCGPGSGLEVVDQLFEELRQRRARAVPGL